MFRLTIDLPPAPTVTVYPGREVARAELARIAIDTGYVHRVTDAGWTHTSYDILTPEDQTRRGRAAIDEVCRCEHIHREHDDVGCTVTTLDGGGPIDCECREYQPISAEPTLFDLDEYLATAEPRPT
jgi:hypothetical protein